jgi:hypothetical protein
MLPPSRQKPLYGLASATLLAVAFDTPSQPFAHRFELVPVLKSRNTGEPD